MARTTLKKFIENFNVKPFSRFTGEELPDLKQLSSKQKYDLTSKLYIKEVLSVKNDHIYYVINHIHIQRCGKNYFKRSTVAQSIFIGQKEVVIKRNNILSRDSKLVLDFLKLCNRNYFYDIEDCGKWYISNNSSIFKSILVGTIYNQETLYTAIGKRILHVNINWRYIKSWLTSDRSICLTDLNYYTKNIYDSINIFNNSTYYEQCLLRDLLVCAIQLDEIVDFTWSDKRIREEHKRQIEQIAELEIENKENLPIFKEFKTPDNIKLLNTEKEIFLEGTNMHHCLYNCYFDKIKNKEYIAFHMYSPEDCTFSFKRHLGNIKLDQIYLKYDKPVREETKAIAIKFMNDYNEQLDKLLKKSYKNDDDMPYFFDDIF